MEHALHEICGDRATTDLWECTQYAQDIAYIPPLLVRLLAHPVPKAVAQPVSAEEITRLLKWAVQKKIPVTVRGGGSTAYYNSVPLHSGLVIDMNRLKGVTEIDRNEETGTPAIWVKAGMTWMELDDELRRQGFTVCSYPSSAPSATVGGWISMGGLGIGSVPYGPVREQVLAIRGVTATGEMVELELEGTVPLEEGNSRSKAGGSGYRMDDFFGTEGTRGIITEVKLQVRTVPETEEHLLAVFTEPAPTGSMMSWLGEESLSTLYNVHFSSPEFIGALQKKGYLREIPEGRFSLEIDLEGRKNDVSQEAGYITGKIKALGGTLLPLETGEEEWYNRYKSLRLKQSYPSLLAAELVLPTRNFADFYQQLNETAHKAKTLTITYAHLVSQETVLVMVLYPSDELKTIRYLADLSFTGRIYKLGQGFGGKPYVIGFWNTPYLGQIYNSREREKRCRRKQTLDPYGILNPGKGYGPPLILNSKIFGFGMAMLSLFRPLVLKGGGGR